MNNAVGARRIEPLCLYGPDISYFTGKPENYCRAKGLRYERRAMGFPADAARFRREFGVYRMPVPELADGRRLLDSTKNIAWLEAQLPRAPLLPPDPLQGFFCRLLED